MDWDIRYGKYLESFLERNILPEVERPSLYIENVAVYDLFQEILRMRNNHLSYIETRALIQSIAVNPSEEVIRSWWIKISFLYNHYREAMEDKK